MVGSLEERDVNTERRSWKTNWKYLNNELLFKFQTHVESAQGLMLMLLWSHGLDLTNYCTNKDSSARHLRGIWKSYQWRSVVQWIVVDIGVWEVFAAEQCAQLGVIRDMNRSFRYKGRLRNSSLPETGKLRAWLPCDHHFRRLTIMDCHHRLMHTKGRQVIRKQVYSCVVSRRQSKVIQGWAIIRYASIQI